MIGRKAHVASDAGGFVSRLRVPLRPLAMGSAFNGKPLVAALLFAPHRAGWLAGWAVLNDSLVGLTLLRVIVDHPLTPMQVSQPASQLSH